MLVAKTDNANDIARISSVLQEIDNGTWVFDDSRTGLVREPFVASVPAMDAIVI